VIKLNRTTEYSLLSLSYIRAKENAQPASAREISEHFHLPFEILAKTLQRLKEQNIIASTFGTRGGYVLARDLKLLDLASFLKMVEGPLAVVSCCASEETACEFSSGCSIQNPMQALNARIADFLSRISVEELTRPGVSSLNVLSGPTTTNTNRTPEVVQLGSLAYGEEP